MTDKKKDQNPTIDELRKLSKLDHDDPRRKAFESKLRIERADNGNFLKNPFVVQAIREELQVLIDQYSSIKEHIKEREKIINSENPFKTLRAIGENKGEGYLEHLFNYYLAPTLKDPEEVTKEKERLQELEDELAQKNNIIEQTSEELKKKNEAEIKLKAKQREGAKLTAKKKKIKWLEDIRDFTNSDYYSKKDTSKMTTYKFKKFLEQERGVTNFPADITIIKHLNDYIKNRSRG